MMGKFLKKRINQKDIIEKWIKEGAKNKSKLARLLNISWHNTNELLDLYYSGKILEPHKNSLMANKNQQVKENIANEYRKYCTEIAKSKNISKFAATFTDFYENQNIEKRYKITYRTVCNYLNDCSIYSPRAKKKKKKRTK